MYKYVLLGHTDTSERISYKVACHKKERKQIVKQKVIVYILNKKGKPLMPTTRCGHVRKLMKENKAVPVCNEPFTIRLKYETPDIVQPLYLGLDTGRENIGI